jgi:hypothetical protein
MFAVVEMTNTVSDFNSRSTIVRGWFFIRAQSLIRADGVPSAQARALLLD